ncbi:MAG: TIR domain-containing protein [Nitrososphaeraceae archaeon]
MVRNVFFSFHFDQDAWRVGQVRNCVTTMNKTPFLDDTDWESIKRGGDTAITRWIDTQLEGTSVTVVLIGRYTSQRRYVRYELRKSWEQNKGILGIYIHNCKNYRGETDMQGSLDFGINFIDKYGIGKSFSERFSIYDWVHHNGRMNIERWIEESAIQAGR